VSADAEQVLEVYRADYLAKGYMYSGEISPQYLARRLGWEFDRALAAIETLVAAGLLQRRDCQKWSYELVAAERRRLIEAHGLAERWLAGNGACFYPTGPYGEVTHVLAETSQEEV
jgi:hypothetical protein